MAAYLVGLRLNEAKSELEPVQNIWDFGFTWIKGEIPSQYPKLRRCILVPNILPENFVVHRSVLIHGINQLGLRSHPTGSPVFEAPTMTFSFIRPDKPIYTTVSFRPFSPCHLPPAMAGLIFSHVMNPYPAFPGGVQDFTDAFTQGGCLDPFRTRAPHQCAGAQGGNIGPQTMGAVLQGHHVMIATDNTTVVPVAYINRQGGTHSHAL